MPVPATLPSAEHLFQSKPDNPPNTALHACGFLITSLQMNEGKRVVPRELIWPCGNAGTRRPRRALKEIAFAGKRLNRRVQSG